VVRNRLLTGLNVLLLLAFAFSVVVQVNDPDPFAWMAMYGLAAAACLLALLRRGHWVIPALVGLTALGWALGIAPRVVGQVRFLDMFGAFEMKSMAIEESREMYGLLIIAAWMAVLTVAMRPRAEGDEPGPG